VHRIRSLVVALALLGVTAGLAAAHVMPAASNDGLATAEQASGKDVPLGVDGSVTDRTADDEATTDEASAPTDTHGATVSDAAQAETPDGFDNHGAYVSSVAIGWGTQTADAHRNDASTGALPDAAQQGLSHRP
jgi:hypothetical protein